MSVLSPKQARQLFAIHRWTGLLTGVVIVFLSLTGAGLVFITEIDRAMNHSMLTSSGSGQRITPEQAIASVKQEFPKARVSSLHLPQRENDVYLANVGKQKVAGVTFNEISIDPYSGKILGKRDHSKTLAFVLRQMHLRFFFFGWKGRVVVGAFGVLLLFSTLTGFLIYGRFIKALPKWYSIRRERGFQISTSDWHKLIGIGALAFNLIIAVTGAVLGLENLARYSPAVSEAIHPKPAKGTVPKRVSKDIVPVSVALNEAEHAIPGFTPTQINIPTKKNQYFVYGKVTGHPRMENASEVGINAETGKTFFVSDARTARAVTRTYYWMDPLHFGYWGGIFSQVLYLFFGLTAGFLAASGYIVWYMKTFRKPRRQASQAAVAA